MGLRFRKSVKISNGIRLNANKKSLGVTFGEKGMHYTLNTSGRKTSSVGIPGTGLYYQDIRNTSSKKSSNDYNEIKTNKIGNSNYLDYENQTAHYGKNIISVKKLGRYSIIFRLLGILFLLCGVFSLPIGIIFCIIGIFSIVSSISYASDKKKLVNYNNILKTEEKDTTCELHNTKILQEENISTCVKEKDLHIETHHVAGTSYRQKQIESLGIENDDYDLSKREMIDYELDNQKNYHIIFKPKQVDLVEEPDNEIDPNAIKVIIDNVHVGYIKKGSCAHIKRLMKSDSIKSIKADIHGGKYKILSSEYDLEKDKDVYSINTGNTDFFVNILITTN